MNTLEEWTAAAGAGLGLAPGSRAVVRPLQVAGLGQLRIVGQIKTKHTADHRAIGQGRLGLPRNAVEAGLECVGAYLLPRLACVGRAKMNVSHVEPRHVVARFPWGRPGKQVQHFFRGPGPALNGTGRLREAGHQAAVRHRPGADPAGEARLLRRVVDGLPLMVDGRELVGLRLQVGRVRQDDGHD